MKRSLLAYFTFHSIIAFIVPLVIGGAIFYQILSDVLNKTFAEKNRQIIQVIDNELDTFLSDIRIDFDEILQFIDIQDINDPLFQNYLTLKVTTDPKISLIQILDDNYIVKKTAPHNEALLNLDLSLHPSIRNTTNLEGYNWSDVFVSPLTGDPTVTISALNKGYIFVLYINVDFLKESITIQRDISTGFFFLLDRKGNYISHPDSRMISRRENLRGLPEVMSLINNSGIEESTSIQEENILTFKIHKGSHWIVGYSQKRTEEFALLKTLRNTAALILIGSFSFAFVMLLWINRNFRKMIQRIIIITRSIKEGKYETYSGSSQITELDELSDDFSDMAMAVNKREEELQSLRDFLTNIVDSMPSVLFSTDQNGIITLWNKKAEEIHNIKSDEAIGRPVEDLLPYFIENKEKLIRSIIDKKIITIESQKRISGKQILYEDIIIYPLTTENVNGAVVRIDDITNQFKMNEMMIQNEKMLSVGGLAAGMAHEINNPLAGIIQTSIVLNNRLYNKLEQPSIRKRADEAGVSIEGIKKFIVLNDIPRMVDSILKSGERVSKIIQNMLSFARKNDDFRSTHDLNKLVEKAVELASTDFDLKKKYDFRNIKIEKDYGHNIPAIPCDESKIQQVLLNLLKNGSQAMEESQTENPHFRINTRFEIDSSMAVIEIQDNGPGIPPHVQKRIFEPFFTTKPEGIGTGLGLSISYFIISENHSGRMFVESTPNEGAKFTIKLPVESQK